MILGIDKNTVLSRMGPLLGVFGVGSLLPVCVEAQTELDVLVVYTQAVEDYYGDEDGVLAHVQSGISSANTGLTNSENSFQLVLRDLQKISYVEGSSLPDDLTHITSSSEVATLRNQVGADLVCLFRNGNAGGFSGYGWVLGNESGDPSGGFSVVGSQSAVSTLTFQHEVGHNLGGAHDRNNASVGGLYSYSYGYRFTGGDSTQYRTIMAYAPGQSINYFSNPNVDYQATPTGIASGADSADNARTFNMIASVVEAYRDRIGEGENSSPTLVLPIPDQVANVDAEFELNVSSNFDDIDIGDVLDFSATLVGGDPLPLWLALGSSTGLFSGTPSDSDVETLMVEVTASDGGASVSDDFELVVEFANEPPVLLSPIEDQTALVDVLFSLDVSGNFEDPNEDPLQFGATLGNEDPLPDWLDIDFETGVFSGTPTSSDVGTLSILVGAFDGEDVAVDTFSLSVEFPNQDPVVVQAIPDQVVDQDMLFSLDVSSNFGDADVGDTLTFEATLEGGVEVPIWLTFDEGTGIFTGTPLNDDVAVLSVEVAASDGQASIADVFLLTVNNVNDSPLLLASIPDQNAVEDVLFSLDLTSNFDDIDVGDSLTFEATLEGGGDLPGWIEMEEISGVLSGTPFNGDVGSITIEIAASDGELSVSDVFDLVVENSNDFPLLLLGIPGQSANEDVLFTLDVSSNFGDPDLGDTLSFTATLENEGALPEWLSLDPSTGIFSGTPANEDVGLLLVEVTASDGESSVSDAFELTIANVNDAPMLVVPIPDQEAMEDMLFNLDLSPNFEDVDLGDSLTYSASLESGGDLPGWLDLDSSSGIFSGTPLNEDVESISIEVTVFDGETSVLDVFKIIVGNTNDPPELLSAILDQETAEDGLFYLDVSPNFGDVDTNDALTYAASLEDGGPIPQWMSFDTSSGVFSGIPENGDVGEISIEVSATDGIATVSDVFTLIVENVNDGPIILESIGDQLILEGENYQLDVSPHFTDVDAGDTLSYSASLMGGGSLPEWLMLDATSGLFTGMPDVPDIGLIIIDLIVSDGELSVSDSFSITVKTVNSLPILVNPIEDQSINEGESFYLNVSPHFNDVDEEDTLSFETVLENEDPFPDWLGFDEATGEFSGIPGNEDVGTISIRVTASDGLESVADSFVVEVTSVNQSPITVSDLENRIIQEGEKFDYAVSGFFEDPDEEDILTYSASLQNGDELPAWLEFDSSFGVFSGVPWGKNVGSLAIIVSASDGDMSVASEFLLQIVNYLKIVKIGHDLYLELSDPVSGLEYELWESKDLINWQLSVIQPVEVDGKLIFEIPNSLSRLYRIEVSE